MLNKIHVNFEKVQYNYIFNVGFGSLNKR